MSIILPNKERVEDLVTFFEEATNNEKLDRSS